MQKTEVTTEIELDASHIEELFDAEFKDWCPICRNTAIIDGVETICCGCLAQALAYHTDTCGCFPDEVGR